MDEKDPWSSILAAVAFGIRATVSTTMRALLMQLVFGRDAILSITHKANWQYIKEKKQQLIKQNNKRENVKRLGYKYQEEDLLESIVYGYRKGQKTDNCMNRVTQLISTKCWLYVEILQSVDSEWIL